MGVSMNELCNFTSYVEMSIFGEAKFVTCRRSVWSSATSISALMV